MPGKEQSQPNTSGTADGTRPAQALTPELVRQVADKVYALLQADLAVERERYRPLAGGRPSGWRGGWR